MRRHVGTLVVAGLVVLVVAAAVEAVRDDDSPPPAASPPPGAGSTYEPPNPREELDERGVAGRLYATRRVGGGCRFLAFLLPDLAPQIDLLTTLCKVELAPDGPAVALGSPCPGTVVEVRDLDGRLAEPRRRGCAPAWTPGGRFTFVRDGSVVIAGDRVVLSRERFLSELRRAPYLPRAGRYSIRDVAWLTESRLVVVARHRTTATANDFMAIFERGRLHPAAGVNQWGRLRFMYVDPALKEIVTADLRWSYWDARGNYLRDRRGVFGANSAFVRSPDRRWTATAGRDSVYIFPSLEEVRPVDPVEIEVAGVVDLAWG